MKMMITAVVVAVVFSACTSQSDEAAATVPAEPRGDVTEADWLPRSSGPPVTSLGALFEGALRINISDRCVTVLASDGREVLVVFVDGATLDITDPTSPVLVRHNGERYEDGSSIALGGGSWGYDPNFATASDPVYQSVEIPESCLTNAVWIAAP